MSTSLFINAPLEQSLADSLRDATMNLSFDNHRIDYSPDVIHAPIASDISDLKIIAELVKALNVPINIVGRAGGAGVAELGRLGVARISTASGPSLVVMSLIKQIAEELRTKGQFDVLKSSMKRLDVQQLFAARSN